MYQVEDSQCEVTQVVEARYGLQNLTRRRGWHGGRSFGAELRVVGKSVTPQRLPNGVPNLRMEKKNQQHAPIIPNQCLAFDNTRLELIIMIRQDSARSESPMVSQNGWN